MSEHRLHFSPGKDIECFVDEVRSRHQAAATKLSGMNAQSPFATAENTCGGLNFDQNGTFRLDYFCGRTRSGWPSPPAIDPRH